MRITIEVTEEKEYEIEHNDDYYIDESVVWEIRDMIEPPSRGFVMYSTSGAEHNLEYLLEKGWKPEHLMVCTIAGHDTVWRLEAMSDEGEE
jgi:hypothetical protein